MKGLLSPNGWSISVRIAAWYTSTVLIIVTVFSTLTYVSYHGSLHRDFDEHLNHEHKILTSQIDYGPSGIAFESPNNVRVAPYTTQGIYGTYVRLLDENGAIVFSSPNFQGHDFLPVTLPQQATVKMTSIEWENAPLRLHYWPLIDESQTLHGWLEVSGFEWALHQNTDRLLRTFVLGILLTGFVSLLGGVVLAKRTLNPISQIITTANKIDLSRLDLRIPIRTKVNDELTELSRTLNRLFGRIQESFQRERRFSANAAHEIVTPLATLRAELELALKAKEMPEPARKELANSMDEVDRIEHIVRSLLLLSSAESVADQKFSKVNISKICADQCERFSDRSTVDDLAIHSELSPGMFILGNEKAVITIVDNLLDNALKYSNRGGKIQLSTFARDGNVCISVKDQGIGFSEHDKDHLFDRFYRATSAEVQKRKGSGIGLSIVAATTKAMNGSLEAHSEGLGMGSEFIARFPSI